MCDEGAVAIAELMTKTQTLKEVHLIETKIGDAGAVALANNLRTNRSVEILNLMLNDISDKGAVEIAKSLEHNPTLRIIDLEANKNITDNGFEAFVKVPLNFSLQKIELNMKTAISPSLLATFRDKLNPKDNFSAALNMKGRRLLLADHDAPPGLWAHVLAGAGDSSVAFGPSMVYYFLCEKPNLCSFVPV